MTHTEQLLAEILSELRRGPTLGFGHPPSPRYIYANRQYSDCLWYFWNGEKKEHEPIAHHALTGVIEKLEIETKEYKGKPDVKLNLHLQADRRYVIQAGFETEFSKGLLARLNLVRDLKPAITIAVQAGETEQVLFCRVWDSQGVGIKVESQDGLDFVAIAAAISQRIGGEGDRRPQPTVAQPKPLKPQVKGDKISADQRRELINHGRSKGLSDDGLKHGLKLKNLTSTADLTELDFAELMVAICDEAIVAHWNKESAAEVERVGVW